MSSIAESLLSQDPAWRQQTGNDKYDEMWAGVLHMTPAPRRSHQDFLYDLGTWLRTYWARPQRWQAHQDVNVASPGGWPDNFRVPDFVLLSPDCPAVDHDVYIEGPPTVVVEIRSPGDDTMKKLPFYAKIGVPEVWLIDRDTRRPEVLVLREGRYQPQSPAEDGWLDSAATGVRLRGEPGNLLAMQLAADEATRRLLPEA